MGCEGGRARQGQSWETKVVVRDEDSPCNTKASILHFSSKAPPILGKVRRCEHAYSHRGPSPGSGVAYAPTKLKVSKDVCSVVSKVPEPHHKRDPSARKVTPSISRHSSAGTDWKEAALRNSKSCRLSTSARFRTPVRVDKQQVRLNQPA